MRIACPIPVDGLPFPELDESSLLQDLDKWRLIEASVCQFGLTDQNVEAFEQFLIQHQLQYELVASQEGFWSTAGKIAKAALKEIVRIIRAIIGYITDKVVRMRMMFVRSAGGEYLRLLENPRKGEVTEGNEGYLLADNVRDHAITRTILDGCAISKAPSGVNEVVPAKEVIHAAVDEAVDKSQDHPQVVTISDKRELSITMQSVMRLILPVESYLTKTEPGHCRFTLRLFMIV